MRKLEPARRQPQADRDQQLEARLDDAVAALVGAVTLKGRRRAWRLMLKLRGQRSPEYVARLERMRLERVRS